jgi:hypothetical protein
MVITRRNNDDIADCQLPIVDWKEAVVLQIIPLIGNWKSPIGNLKHVFQPLLTNRP